MVGEAFTLRYIPAREDLNPIACSRIRAHPQRKAVEECPPGAVLVIDSRKDARAASAGGILVTRLMKRGVAGVVTDGGFRDRPRSPGSTFPRTTTAPPRRPTSRCTRRSTSTCRSAAATSPVWPGDVIVGDGEGVVVIPAHLADEIAAEAVEMTAFEDFVTEKVRKGRSILGLYPPTDEQTKVDFQAWRTKHAR